ncbi:testis-specific gene A8 protein-like [Schistocerca gregaria]|uniref:testis-specific gene A8 protein-like n=1 Tax=Schistocerca gregaria TaxID=7010 RepID=UPI00211E1D02|nr:testis-specific gene A8 protein-like [Schistocerca gregaria]
MYGTAKRAARSRRQQMAAAAGGGAAGPEASRACRAQPAQHNSRVSAAAAAVSPCRAVLQPHRDIAGSVLAPRKTNGAPAESFAGRTITRPRMELPPAAAAAPTSTSGTLSPISCALVGRVYQIYGRDMHWDAAQLQPPGPALISLSSCCP